MKLRSVNTNFWDDPFITELNSSEKLLFLYLITNPLTNLIGIYPITLKRISFDTGLSIPTVKNALKKFAQNRKVYYLEDYIILVNWLKNQNLNKNMQVAVVKEFASLSKSIKEKIFGNGSEGFGNGSEGFETIKNRIEQIKFQINEIEEEGEKKINYTEEEKQMFKEFWTVYPGTKRGVDVEFGNFIKKYKKEWRTILPLLKNRLDYQFKAKQIRKSKGWFVPEWKFMSTWINNRGWEEVINYEKE